MRRLFSTFAPGAPGAGLLLMRLAAGGALLAHGIAGLDAAGSAIEIATRLIAGVIGALLLAGLFTPVAAVLAALDAAWIALSRPGEGPFWLLAGIVCIALALVGPGAWSVDARLFGWKRVHIRNANGGRSPLDRDQNGH